MAQRAGVLAQRYGTFGTRVQRGVVPDPIDPYRDPDRDPGGSGARAGEPPPYFDPAGTTGDGKLGFRRF